jgi:SAM-dependent methyltransferase
MNIEVTNKKRLRGAVRQRAERLARSAADALSTSVPPTVGGPNPPIELPAFPTALDRPLPDGWTETEIRSVMATFQIDGSQVGELKPYVDDALWRFLHTWGMVRDQSGRALELGSNPYFITWLLQEFTELKLDLANYFGGDVGLCRQRLQYSVRGEHRDETLEYQQFNLEEDVFPFEGETFSVVVFCEILEHLLMDPLQCLREIHRVLVPGGLIALSTPNVSRIGNVLSMVEGLNIYDPYSGYGPYGRHNREFNRHELHRLLEFAGFGDITSFTADAHPSDQTSRPSYTAVAPSLTHRQDDLGQYIFVSARASGVPRSGFPSSFYRSWPADKIVDY